jgi:hypothetical protein
LCKCATEFHHSFTPHLPLSVGGRDKLARPIAISGKTQLPDKPKISGNPPKKNGRIAIPIATTYDIAVTPIRSNVEVHIRYEGT